METVGLFEGRVGGVEKMTLLDFPNRISAILFCELQTNFLVSCFMFQMTVVG